MVISNKIWQILESITNQPLQLVPNELQKREKNSDVVHTDLKKVHTHMKKIK